jgi:flagellar biosynthesis protein FlhG
LSFLGYLEKSSVVNKAVRNQQPFLLSSPLSPISKSINIMALNFADIGKHDELKQENSFAQKLKDLFFGRGG